MKGLILIAMIFCHIVDDYYLQGILASMKQKEWWQVNAPRHLYKYDYLMALFMHSFSWTCSIMLVPIIYVFTISETLHQAIYLFLFVENIAIHMFVDDLKANRREINLISDQLLHLYQIFLTWFVLVF